MKLKRTVRLPNRALPLSGMALLFTALCSTAEAEEPERTQARALGYAGVEAYAARDFATATVKLEAAYRLLAVPTLGLWSARALVKLGKWVEAEERYRLVGELVVSAADSEVQRRAQEEAKGERDALLLEMPSVLIQLIGARPSEVEISIDGVSMDRAAIESKRWVNPGRHVVRGVRGAETLELAFEARAREHDEIPLRFAEGPSAPEPTTGPRLAAQSDAAPKGVLHDSLRDTLRDVGWISVGASGVSLLTGSLAYFMGRRHYTTLERQNWCANDACDSNDVDAYNTWRAVNLTGLIGGAAFGVAGVGLLIATSDADDAEQVTTVTLRLNASTLTLGGHF